MFAEFEPSAFTWWENIPREFGGWDHVAVAVAGLVVVVALLVVLTVRLARRVARHAR